MGGGALWQKNWAKNMQNFGRFYATSEFDREYLRKGSRYPKSESYFPRLVRSMRLPKSPNMESRSWIFLLQELA